MEVLDYLGLRSGSKHESRTKRDPGHSRESMRNLALNDDRICAAVIVHFPVGDAVFELRTLQSETPSQVLAVYGERSATVRYEAAFDRGRSQWLRRVSTAKRKRPDDVGRGL